MCNLKKIIPLIILISGLILFFVFGGNQYLNLETLSNNYQKLINFTDEHYIISVLIYMLTYIGVVAFSIPGATVMTLIGGFLFGVVLGSIWVVLSASIGASIGASITFLAVNTAFGSVLKNQVDTKMSKIYEGFRKNAFNYLLTIRLIPIFPFFAINIAAGVFGMKLRTFFLATFLGIMPGSAIYAWVGSGLGYTLEQGKSIDLGIIFEPQVFLPLIGLAALSLLLVIIKKFKRNPEDITK